MTVSVPPRVATLASVTSHPYTATPSPALLRDPDWELGQRPPGSPPPPDPLSTRARQAQGARGPPPAPPALPSARPPPRGPARGPEGILVQSKDSPCPRPPPPWASFHPAPRARLSRALGPAVRLRPAPRHQRAETKRRRPRRSPTSLRSPLPGRGLRGVQAASPLPGPQARGPRAFGAAFRVGDAGRRGRRLVLSGARRRRLKAQLLRGRAHPAPPRLPPGLPPAR